MHTHTHTKHTESTQKAHAQHTRTTRGPRANHARTPRAPQTTMTHCHHHTAATRSGFVEAGVDTAAACTLAQGRPPPGARKNMLGWDVAPFGIGKLVRWVQRRCKYYAAMEPQDAPRDEAPFLPRETPLSLRLEDEASMRMWSLLLESDNMEGINYAEERMKVLNSGIAEAQERSPPEPIPEEAERIINRPAYENGNRIEKEDVFAQQTRP